MVTDQLPPWCQDFWFSTVTALDALLVFSLVFSALYSLFLCIAYCFPRPFLSRCHAGITMLLCGTAFSLMFTDAGDLAAGTANGALRAIPFFMKEALLVDSIPLIWMAGSLLSLILFLWELAGLRRLAADSESVSGNPAFNKACLALGMRGTILLKSAGTNSPAASWGLFARHVFIPGDFTSIYSYEEQYYIFLHELMHIRRLDTVKYLCARLTGVLFWFHPLVLLSIRNIRDAIETGCDWETVRRHDVHRLSYARLIVKAHTNLPGSIPGFSHGATHIKQRLGHITGDREWIRAQLRSLLIPSLMAAATLLVVCTGRFVQSESPPSPVLLEDPNGMKIRVTTHLHWRGALGTYSIASAISDDNSCPPENPSE